ncbi:hypothetical protein L933_06815 [Helicobacter pylori PZ5056]|uniref:Uncharacterized protein n=1 Tax=Helicobacter pylori PZ5056 TaxID=1337393 RepID=T2T2V8_HELPX|nr:hypothetical protein L933_06815 [Helicobacter pylori PZ5056]
MISKNSSLELLLASKPKILKTDLKIAYLALD